MIPFLLNEVSIYPIRANGFEQVHALNRNMNFLLIRTSIQPFPVIMGQDGEVAIKVGGGTLLDVIRCRETSNKIVPYHVTQILCIILPLAIFIIEFSHLTSPPSHVQVGVVEFCISIPQAQPIQVGLLLGIHLLLSQNVIELPLKPTHQCIQVCGISFY